MSNVAFPNRTVKVVSTLKPGEVFSYETNASTWGEFLELNPTINDILPNNYAAMIKNTRSKIIDEDTPLPFADANGNRLDIIAIMLTPKETSAGINKRIAVVVSQVVKEEVKEISETLRAIADKVDDIEIIDIEHEEVSSEVNEDVTVETIDESSSSNNDIPLIPTEELNPRKELENLTVAQLREKCKKLGLKITTKLNKGKLINLLLANEVKPIEMKSNGDTVIPNNLDDRMNDDELLDDFDDFQF